MNDNDDFTVRNDMLLLADKLKELTKQNQEGKITVPELMKEFFDYRKLVDKNKGV